MPKTANVGQLPSLEPGKATWILDDCNIYYLARSNRITGEWLAYDDAGGWSSTPMTEEEAARIADRHSLLMCHPSRNQMIKATTYQRIIANNRATRPGR